MTSSCAKWQAGHSRLEDQRGKGIPSEGSWGQIVPRKGCQKGHKEPLSEKGLAKGAGSHSKDGAEVGKIPRAIF